MNLLAVSIHSNQFVRAWMRPDQSAQLYFNQYILSYSTDTSTMNRDKNYITHLVLVPWHDARGGCSIAKTYLSLKHTCLLSYISET